MIVLWADLGEVESARNGLNGFRAQLCKINIDASLFGASLQQVARTHTHSYRFMNMYEYGIYIVVMWELRCHFSRWSYRCFSFVRHSVKSVNVFPIFIGFMLEHPKDYRKPRVVTHVMGLQIASTIFHRSIGRSAVGRSDPQ